MSYFFFDLFDGKTTTMDNVGVELSDISAARERAQAIAFSKTGPFDSSTERYDPRELRVRASAGQCVAKIALRYITT